MKDVSTQKLKQNTTAAGCEEAGKRKQEHADEKKKGEWKTRSILELMIGI